MEEEIKILCGVDDEPNVLNSDDARLGYTITAVRRRMVSASWKTARLR